MHQIHRWIRVSLVVLTLSAFSGCGGGGGDSFAPADSTEEAKVSGTVKIHGKPMSGGQISFSPPANVAAKEAEVKSDGTFEVTTLVGKNSVRISGPAVTKEPELAYESVTVDVPSGGSSSLVVEVPPAK